MAIDNTVSVRLFNDVYLGRTAPQTTCNNITWAPFPRLPAELRLHVWLLFLRQHRMIELWLYIDGDINGQSRRYTYRNDLGKVVSGQGYTLETSGRGFAASLSPLLWVNREARQATLSFYRVHLPFPRYNGNLVLYLNPEYDVLYLGPREQYRHPALASEQHWDPTLLSDFLHDVRAHDPRDQGYGKHSAAIFYPRLTVKPNRPPFIPGDLHPAAAKSFADILRCRLLSVLFIVRFRTCMRGIGEPPPGYPFHFAQTFPLRRRGRPVGALRWLDTDPRWGVEFDLLHVSLGGDPRPLARAWGGGGDAGFRFYICPTLDWPGQPQLLKQFRSNSSIEERSREELARHLQEEEVQWLKDREHLRHLFSTVPVLRDQPMMPRHGPLVDAEMFEMMESAPCTAIGMWKSLASDLTGG
ncbi:hypothetical protein C8A03DRAFT_45942 [Achaetomium macrosporum]|uniref:2EXR domain-containing protein n=1 Tax=Achaetomium macrosporum TaxID=79813 RepID=A0AAN7HA61_9PEZI|nr:hypothetical protein C8A03DRAFT_45942 [Achaetomium macrosporum]